MSKNFVSPPCNSGKISIDGPSNIYPSFSQGLPSSVPNANPRPPVFFVATGLRHVLNYSFQTGEEFALEFMQDKANTRKPSVPTISDERIIATSYVERREQPSVSEEKPHRKLLTCPLFNSTSSQGSCKKFPPEIYDSQPTRMKFLCNFGGRFLPRPSDGELRYVGGEKHLIRISRDMSWQGLISKTTKLIKRAHTIKYHLPGEEVNVLISVASDDDLHHMFDECTVLEESKERPVMYLFSDDNDEHHVHFFMGSSSDAETEAQFISLVNGLSGPGKALSTQDLGSASASNLDQLMFDIDDEGSLTGRTEEASTYIRSRPSQGIITVVSTESRAPLEKIPSSLQAQTANQDYATQNNEREVSSSSRRIRNFHTGSSVPSEFANPAKWEQGDGKAVPRQQSELQRTVTNMTARGQRGTKDQDRQQSRRELLIPSDVCTLQTPSPCSNYTSTKPQTSSANKFPQFDNSSELQQLMAQELVGRSEYEMLASLSGDSKKLVCQHTSSDDTMMAPGGCSSQEDVLPYAATNPLSKNGNTQLLHLEVADPSYASRSNESGALISWHDDTYISMSPHTQDWPFVINSRQMQQPAAPDVMYSNANKKDHPSKPTGNDSETVPCPHPFISSDKKGIKLQTNSSVYSSGEKEQRSSSNGRQDAESSKITRSRSLPDGNSQQTRTPSQEVKGNGTPLIAELEVEESNSKPALPENSALGKGIISNVQIINNEDLEDLREMGSGAFGTVFHGRWKGTDVAIKRIKNSCFTYPSPERDKLIIEFWREAAILSKLHHPNVLAFYGIVNNGPGGTLATVTEFMVNGSLKKALLRKDKFLDRRKRIMLAMDAAIGMEYLHSKDIIHFDLKCDNLLVNLKDPSRPICKVADFGLSKMKQTTMVSGGMRGTLPWMAPELLTMSSSKVSDKVDVYSFGIVMWEILTGEEPYDGMHYGGVIGGILSNTLRPPVSNSCDPEWRRLMEQCWSTDPELRPSFTEVAIRLRAILEASQSQPAS